MVTVSGNRHEVDHPDALAVNDGVALFAGPGGVPVIFDFEGVNELIGDLSGRRPRRKRPKRRLRWRQFYGQSKCLDRPAW